MIVSSYIRAQRLLRCVGGSVSAFAAVALLTGTLHATPVPANLGNGLDKLVNSHLAVTEAAKRGLTVHGAVKTADGKVYTDQATANMAALGITDDTGRVLVRVTLNGKATFSQTRKAMKAAAASFTVTAKDKTYRGVGIMNAYVDVADVAALCAGNRRFGGFHGIEAAGPQGEHRQGPGRCRSQGDRGRGADQARHRLRPGRHAAPRGPDQQVLQRRPPPRITRARA